MDFESLKEQLIDRLFALKAKVEESELYIRGQNSYDNLTPQMQNLVKAGVGLVLFLFLLSIPNSYLSSAQEKMATFEFNRQLTRDLIRAGRIARTITLPPGATGLGPDLSAQVEEILTRQNVLPEQKVAITPQADVASAALVPKAINQKGLKASLKDLTIRQAVLIGEALHQLNSTKLINMAIQADGKDPHFYSVDFEVASFSVPMFETPQEEPKKPKAGRGRRARGTDQ